MRKVKVQTVWFYKRACLMDMVTQHGPQSFIQQVRGRMGCLLYTSRCGCLLHNIQNCITHVDGFNPCRVQKPRMPLADGTKSRDQHRLILPILFQNTHSLHNGQAAIDDEIMAGYK